MVIALFALSLVMIVGGIAAVVQGFPYVRLESGLAMVIGGTTAASAGVVLLGLGAAVMQLRRMESLLGRGRGDAPAPYDEAPSFETALQVQAVESAPPIRTVPRPTLTGAAGLAGATLGAVAAADRHDGAGQGGLAAEREAEQEPLLPDLLPDEPEAPIGPDEDLFARPEDRPGHAAAADATSHAEPAEDDAGEAFALRPALDEPPPAAGPAPSVETPPAPAASAAPKPERQAVGSYASGGNTYVMYSDGTIDADTPRGHFTFQSLDELKDFVASGEAGERGAA